MAQSNPFFDDSSGFLNNDENLPKTGGKVIGGEDLLDRFFAQNPQQGAELLFRRYYANLCNHAIRFVFSRDIAEEIVAEVFANFWQSRAYEKNIVSYPAYLYQAVRYRSYNYLKHELNRSAPLDALALRPDSGPDPEEILRYNDLSRKIDALIQQLPPQSRRAFLLNRVEGLKYSDVALEMNITVSAVERLISRALAKLRQDLKDDLKN